MLSLIFQWYNIYQLAKQLLNSANGKDRKKVLRLQIAFVLKGLALAFNAIASWLIGQPDNPQGQ